MYNFAKAIEQLMIEPELLKDILITFFDEADVLLNTCEEAIKNEDFVVLSKTFHNLKGASANLRMEEISGLFHELEIAAKEYRMLDITTRQMPLLYNELQLLKESLSPYLK